MDGGRVMEIFEIILWMIGIIVLFLVVVGLQRIFSAHTLVNGFMDLDKLKAICPELFNRKEKEKEK
jgi:hypothetical protein